MYKFRSAIFVLSLFLVPFISRSEAVKEQKHSVDVRFIQFSYSDDPFYLLYRSMGQFSQLETDVPMGKIPSLDQLISLPAQAPRKFATTIISIRRFTSIGAPQKRSFLSLNQVAHISASLRTVTSNSAISSIKVRLPIPPLNSEKTVAPAEKQQIDTWKQQ